MSESLASETAESITLNPQTPASPSRDSLLQRISLSSPLFAQKNTILRRDDPRFCLRFESVQSHLRNLLKNTSHTISTGNHIRALLELREAEMIADVYLQHTEQELPDDVVLLLLCNLGICFYHENLPDDALSCFESCHSRLDSQISYFFRCAEKKSRGFDPELFSEHLRLSRFKLLSARLKLASANLLEQFTRKHEALRAYKHSVATGMDLLLDLMMFVMIECGLVGDKLNQTNNQCAQQVLKKKFKRNGETLRSVSLHRSDEECQIHEGLDSNQNTNRNARGLQSLQKYKFCPQKNNLEQLMESPANKLLFVFYKNMEDVFPYFRKVFDKVILLGLQNSVFRKLMNRHPSVNEIELPIGLIKEAFVKGQNIFSQSLARLLPPRPVTFEQLNQPFFSNPLTVEFVLELIIHLTLSLFKLSSLRMAVDSKTKAHSSRTLSQILMNKCLELIYLFLPLNSVFAKEIIRSHSELFGIYRQTIPEYGGVAEQVKFLRSSLNEGQSTRLFVPCIRSLKIKRPYESSDEDSVGQKKMLYDAECAPKRQKDETLVKREPHKKKTTLQEPSRRGGPYLSSNTIRKQQPTLLSKILKLVELDEVIRRQQHQPQPPKQKKCRASEKVDRLKTSVGGAINLQQHRSTRDVKLLPLTPSTRGVKSPPSD